MLSGAIWCEYSDRGLPEIVALIDDGISSFAGRSLCRRKPL